MSDPVYLSGMQCVECGWKQPQIYFHRVYNNRYGCIRCGNLVEGLYKFNLEPDEVVFGNPIYDKNIDRYLIQVNSSKYFVTFKCNPFESTAPISDTTVMDAMLIYFVSGTSSDIVIISEGIPHPIELGQNLLKFYHALTGILGKHTELKRDLNSSSMIRGIRGVLSEGATVIRG